MEIIISAIFESLLKKIGKQIEKAIDEKKNREFFENFKNLNFLAETEDFYKEEINNIFSNSKLAEKIFESATSIDINSHQQVYKDIEDAVDSYYSKNKPIPTNIHFEIIELLKTEYLYLFSIYNTLSGDYQNLYNQLCRGINDSFNGLYTIIQNQDSKIETMCGYFAEMKMPLNAKENIIDDFDKEIYKSHYNYWCQKHEERTLNANPNLKLIDHYIEPHFESGDVLPTITNWIDKASNILFIIGEAGQGKSTLGQNLLYDFVNGDILKGKINNLVYIKLTDLITASKIEVETIPKEIKSISFEIDKKPIDISNQKGLLVYLDGYDEILERLKNLLDCSQEEAERYFVDYISKITNVKFIVSSRRNYVTKYILNHTDDKVATHKLRELSDEEILSWIKEYNEKTSSQYLTDQNKLKQNVHLYELIKIPLLLQLVVVNDVYNEITNRIELYTKLFDKIYIREKTERSNPTKLTKGEFEEQLSKLAYKLFSNDKKAIEFDIDEEMYKNIVFHFYTKANNTTVEFLHNSFYQYFLAVYIVGLMIKKDYMALFECLSYKNLFFDELIYILEYQKKYASRIDYSSLIETIENTNCILVIPTGKNRLENAERAFYNIINIIIESFKSTENRLPANRFEKSLKAYNCVGLDLSFADLSSAKLAKINFTKCNLIHANLNYAELKEADLSNAKLLNATLSNAYLANATLKSSILIGADLTSAVLRSANLNKAKLNGANLFNANFVQVNLNSAVLINANLSLANLAKASIISANLTGANLTGANLTNANLTGTKLTGADLTGAILRGAIFDQSKLSPEQLSQAVL